MGLFNQKMLNDYVKYDIVEFKPPKHQDGSMDYFTHTVKCVRVSPPGYSGAPFFISLSDLENYYHQHEKN